MLRLQLRLNLSKPVFVSAEARETIKERERQEALEEEARRRGALRVQLDSRESAVPFYEKNGYAVVAESYLLWGEIPHFLMVKEL